MFKQIILLALLLAGSQNSYASGIEGKERYTPTAIEWLTLYCNSLATNQTGYNSSCVSDNENTITVTILYWDKSLSKIAKDEFIPINFILSEYAKEKGWYWLVIKKNIKYLSK